MMRHAADQWSWAGLPTQDSKGWAFLRWKNGALYAGPADSALSFPVALVEQSSLLLCSRAEALRMAVEGKVQA